MGWAQIFKRYEDHLINFDWLWSHQTSETRWTNVNQANATQHNFVCRNTIGWHLYSGICLVESFACELAFGIFRLGTSVLLAKVSLGSFAWEISFGISRLPIVMRYRHARVQQNLLANRYWNVIEGILLVPSIFIIRERVWFPSVVLGRVGVSNLRPTLHRTKSTHVTHGVALSLHTMLRSRTKPSHPQTFQVWQCLCQFFCALVSNLVVIKV